MIQPCRLKYARFENFEFFEYLVEFTSLRSASIKVELCSKFEFFEYLVYFLILFTKVLNI